MDTKISLLRNLRKSTKATILVALAIISATGVAAVLAEPHSSPKTSTLSFHDSMRKLWEDHITWTRLVIVSVLQGLPDTDTTVARLLQNQADIGNAIKPFYGDRPETSSHPYYTTISR